MPNSTSIVTRALALWITFFGVVVVSAQWAPATQPQWDQQSANAMAMLQTNAVRQGNDFYTQFSLLSAPAQSQQSGGPIPALRPGAAEQPLTQGIVRISTGGPSSSPGYVSVRLYQYSLYQPGMGWGRPKRLLIHFWEWTAPPRGGPLISKTDAVYGTSDGGITEFVASLFNVRPNQVICRRPQSIPN